MQPCGQQKWETKVLNRCIAALLRQSSASTGDDIDEVVKHANILWQMGMVDSFYPQLVSDDVARALVHACSLENFDVSSHATAAAWWLTSLCDDHRPADIAAKS